MADIAGLIVRLGMDFPFFFFFFALSEGGREGARFYLFARRYIVGCEERNSVNGERINFQDIIGFGS